jgi:hypothetical protein
MSPDVDFFSGLYNRQSCYADRLSEEQLQSIHVLTPLEEALRKWLQQGKDLVLAGNPGDGKTHFLRRLKPVIDRTKADVILDATAEAEYASIVHRWKAARRKKRPFCLAINQGPLNQLLALEGGRLDPLEEVAAQLPNLLYYDDPPKKPKDVLFVDLNLRSVLTPPIIEAALDNLLREEVVQSCPPYLADEGSDGAVNRRALMHPQIRARLVRLLVAAGHTGHHVTMRDLQGFLSYLLFGGRTGPELARADSSFQYRYYNLCFDGEGTLFDAVRSVFDPVRATFPVVDEDLWENTGVRTGWVFSRPPLTPDHVRFPAILPPMR